MLRHRPTMNLFNGIFVNGLFEGCTCNSRKPSPNLNATADFSEADTRQIAIELRHKQTKNQIEVEDLEQMELVPERQSVEEDGHKVIRDTTAAHGDCTIPSSQGSSGEEQHGKGGYSTSQGYGTMEHPGMMPETQNEMPTPDIPTGSNSESHGHAVAPPSDLIGPAGHAGEDWAAIVRELEDAGRFESHEEQQLAAKVLSHLVEGDTEKEVMLDTPQTTVQMGPAGALKVVHRFPELSFVQAEWLLRDQELRIARLPFESQHSCSRMLERHENASRTKYVFRTDVPINIPFVSDRNILRHCFVYEMPGAFVSLSESIPNHPRCPRVPSGAVRGRIHWSAFIVQQAGEDAGVRMLQGSNVDYGGTLPESWVNFMKTRTPVAWYDEVLKASARAPAPEGPNTPVPNALNPVVPGEGSTTAQVCRARGNRPRSASAELTAGPPSKRTLVVGMPHSTADDEHRQQGAEGRLTAMGDAW